MIAKFKNFKVKAEFHGDKAASWNGNNYNYYKVIVKNSETGATTSFDFWASLARPELDTESDVLNAFYCFVSDAVAGSGDFETFCDEYGYNNDSIKALKTFRACKRSNRKFSRVSGFSLDEMYSFLDELCEIAG